MVKGHGHMTNGWQAETKAAEEEKGKLIVPAQTVLAKSLKPKDQRERELRAKIGGVWRVVTPNGES